MAVYGTIALEAQFSGTTWGTCTDYRVSSGIRLSRGIQGNAPTDRVASTGEMSFTLDNSARNSGTLLGYYSPDNANSRGDFNVGINSRLKVTYDGTAYYKFFGKIASVTPSFGAYRDRGVDVVAVDYMDELATHNLRLIPPQTNKRGDELLHTVMDSMTTAPQAHTFSADSDTYLHGLHTEKDERTTGLTACQKIAQSGLDDIYVIGNSTTGETLKYRSRHTRIKQTTVEATFSNDMTGMNVNRAKDQIYTHIKVTTHPLEKDTSPVILYSSTKEIPVSPGQIYKFTARYTDPLSDGRRVSGEDMVVPVYLTDFETNPGYANGPGTALVTSIGTPGANSCEVTLTNTETFGVVYTKFNIRGYGLYEYAPYEVTWDGSAANLALYGDKMLNYDMPYQDNQHHGEDFKNHFSADNATLKTSVESVEFIANISDAWMKAALALDVGSRISVTETVTGISGEYFVNGYGLNIEPGGIIRCILSPLVPAETTTYFQIGGTIGTTSVIGY